MFLVCMATDIEYYCSFIISHYCLDLNDLKTFRDLSKPIGALNEKRLSYFKVCTCIPFIVN